MRIFFIVVVLFVFGCSKTGTRSEALKDSITQQQSMTIDHEKINLDSVLKVEENDLLGSLSNGTLSVCCYDLMDITTNLDLHRFQKKTEEYLVEGEVKVVDVYSRDSSFIKTFYNNHPDVQRTDLVCGRIKDNQVEINGDIKIGMDKNDLLEKLFEESKLFEQVNKLEIYENELGESSTTYIFNDGKLIEVNFNSVYDWIAKDLKK